MSMKFQSGFQFHSKLKKKDVSHITSQVNNNTSTFLKTISILNCTFFIKTLKYIMHYRAYLTTMK